MYVVRLLFYDKDERLWPIYLFYLFDYNVIEKSNVCSAELYKNRLHNAWLPFKCNLLVKWGLWDLNLTLGIQYKIVISDWVLVWRIALSTDNMSGRLHQTIDVTSLIVKRSPCPCCFLEPRRFSKLNNNVTVCADQCVGSLSVAKFKNGEENGSE